MVVAAAAAAAAAVAGAGKLAAGRLVPNLTALG